MSLPIASNSPAGVPVIADNQMPKPRQRLIVFKDDENVRRFFDKHNGEQLSVRLPDSDDSINLNVTHSGEVRLRLESTAGPLQTLNLRPEAAFKQPETTPTVASVASIPTSQIRIASTDNKPACKRSAPVTTSKPVVDKKQKVLPASTPLKVRGTELAQVSLKPVVFLHPSTSKGVPSPSSVLPITIVSTPANSSSARKPEQQQSEMLRKSEEQQKSGWLRQFKTYLSDKRLQQYEQDDLDVSSEDSDQSDFDPGICPEWYEKMQALYYRDENLWPLVTASSSRGTENLPKSTAQNRRGDDSISAAPSLEKQNGENAQSSSKAQNQ